MLIIKASKNISVEIAENKPGQKDWFLYFRFHMGKKDKPAVAIAYDGQYRMFITKSKYIKDGRLVRIFKRKDDDVPEQV